MKEKILNRCIAILLGIMFFVSINAESEDIIKEHAERAGIPANEITLISSHIRA